MGEGPLASLLEVTRGLTILSEDTLAGRRLRIATLANELRVAGMTAAAACSFGVTSELSGTADYTAPRAWAGVLHAAGFDGARYHVRHDPRGSLFAVGWFGRAGRLARPPAGFSQELPAEVLLDAAPFGIRIAGRLQAQP